MNRVHCWIGLRFRPFIALNLSEFAVRTRIRLSLAAIAALFATQTARAADNPPPFESDLMRFSEIVGAVAYLDLLCDPGVDGPWRAKMAALIAAQAMSEDERRRTVDRYNRGYRTFASIHRTCSDQTRSVLKQYLTEGAEIANRIDERFGSGGLPPVGAASGLLSPTD
jgi:uncharacterized protein (TIGR02301 family)